jgi:hypothetical protein
MKRPFIASIFFPLLSCKDDQAQKGISFSKISNPVYEGALAAADPDVIRDGDTLRMYYSSLVIEM